MRKRRRRSLAFLVNQKPQRRFVAMQFVLAAFMMLFLMYVVFQMNFHPGAIKLHDPDALRQYLDGLRWEVFVRVAAVFVFGYIVSIFVGLVFLHRTAGPLVRLKAILNTISEGRIPQMPIQFRRGDYTADLVNSLNRLTDYLKRKRVGK